MTRERPAPDYDEAAEISAAALADRLPGRPLTHSEASDLADALAWSVSTVTYSTESGRDFVPEAYLFRPSERTEDGEDWRGDALDLRMDDRMTEWVGSVEREDVTHSDWVAVIEATGRWSGGDLSVESIVREREDGTTVRRDLRDSADVDGEGSA